MVGRVPPLLLWYYLQPIPLSRLFLFLLPGRDTQEFITDTATSFLTEDLSSLIGYFSTFAWSLLRWMFSAGRVWLLIAVMPVALLTLSNLPDGVSRFTRKHGRWKHRSLFPKTFLVLSAVALSPLQAQSFMAYQPERVRFKITRPSSIITHPPPLTPQQAFTLSVNPACPDGSFFYNEIFDFLPFEDYPEDDNVVPACCLHLSGYAKEWITKTTIIDPFFATKDEDNSSVVTCLSVLSTGSDDLSVTTTDSKENKLQPVDDGILRFTSQAFIPPELV